jgi:hypothetical protein
MLSRAEFLGLVAGAVPAALFSDRVSDRVFAQAADPMRTRVAAFIEAYDSQGIHRTATPVDNASGDWLRRLVEVAGASARMVPFTLDRVDVRAARLDADGHRIEGLPFFDGGFTGDTGIAGALGPPGSNAAIALVTLDQAAIATEGQSIAELRASGSHRGIVAVTRGGTPGLSPSNARSFARPFGVPVLQVASEHQPLLDGLAAVGRDVTLVASAGRESTQGLNIVASLAGRQPDLPPLVVMTPRSGWWQCASERGGGLACSLEIIRSLVAAKPPRSTIFVASSGHELGHFGLDAFLGTQPALVKSAAAWIHLGANIGAAGGAARLQASDDAIEDMALQSLTGAGTSVRQRVPRGTVPSGEARNIHVGGGRYVSLLGSGPLFHNQKDRWPAAVDVDAVTRFARAVASLAVALSRT